MASLQSVQSPIAARTKLCLELFERLKKFGNLPEEPENSAIATEAGDSLGQFKIWAGNIGAFQQFQTKTSLDYRLRDAQKIARQIIELLDDLAESLEDGTFDFKIIPCLSNRATSMLNCLR